MKKKPKKANWWRRCRACEYYYDVGKDICDTCKDWSSWTLDIPLAKALKRELERAKNGKEKS